MHAAHLGPVYDQTKEEFGVSRQSTKDRFLGAVWFFATRPTHPKSVSALSCLLHALCGLRYPGSLALWLLVGLGLWEAPTEDQKRREGPWHFFPPPCLLWPVSAVEAASLQAHGSCWACSPLLGSHWVLRSSNGSWACISLGPFTLPAPLWVVPSLKSLHLNHLGQILFPDRTWLKQVSFSNNILWF